MKLRNFAFAAPIVAVALVLAGCSSSGSTPSASPKPGTGALTVAISSAPVSLDPARASSNSQTLWYMSPAYANLIGIGDDGSFVPALATKWGYVGSGNTKFDLTLRAGLKFADGTALDPQAVIKSFTYYQAGKGANNSFYAGWQMTAKSGNQIEITTPAPTPWIPLLLSGRYLGGAIISPAGLANPATLVGQTYGAGEYALDPSQSVAGDHYTYVKNKYYWDASAVHFASITVKVISNPTSAVQALTTGQVDLIAPDPSVASTATGANLKTITRGDIWQGFFLFDRDGSVVPALKDVKVRQALNYAVDRAGITKAAYGDYGTPTVQPTVPGGPEQGYDSALDKTYSYSPSKAKSLLAAAGYSSGLTIPVFYPAYNPALTKMVQAAASELQAVGVTLELTPASNMGDWVGDLLSKKFAATVYLGGEGPLFSTVGSAFLPTGIMNPYKAQLPEVTSAYEAMNSASSSDLAAAARALNKVVVDQALAIPVSQTNSIYTYNTRLAGVQYNGNSAYLNPIINWYAK